jgi:hypothetical protein
MIGERARAQTVLAIQVDQDRCILRRNPPLGRRSAHVVRMTGDVDSRV